ncbi:ThiF family adenylyltransferase [Microbacterium stercoris]|uniref:ThiF family adenylyltransferase n=1 Tax=Microbacterium stercoris TaxID=2820289 RepID=A0A939TXT0_9MICO|nr:ThiF family adenylyltransferase [Microbacterium stercoris]MBO3663977.1 ThiF family adenylyltransferase [Microbacterium stercoris]
MSALPPLVTPVAALSQAERERTARHHVLMPLGELGQRRLRAAHVAIVGAGGLGSPAVLALAAAGVGTLTVIDNDDVELSNLQRQVMHRIVDIGAPKATSAARAAADLAPEVRVHAVRERLTARNAERLLSGADVVLDGTDTFATRELVATATESLGIPLVWGVVQGFDAQVTVFWSAPPAGFPAVRLSDLYPAGSAGDVPTCAEAGVLGSLCLQVGALMATQAVHLIAGIGEPLLGRILVIDGLRARQHEVPLRGRPSDAPAPVSPAAEHEPERVEVAALRAALSSAAPPLVVDVRGADEVLAGMIPGALHVPLPDIQADPERAADRLWAAAGDRRIAVVCKGGARSDQAATLLAARDLDVVSVRGGMRAWTGETVVPEVAR